MFVANAASIIMIAFDRYIFPSIKDHDHISRGMRCFYFHIAERDQICPADFHSELKNVNFKDALINFIIKD